jgi:hypothetical protein
LFDRLLDDAAMFPPGNADPATAISEHLGYRAGDLDRYVGPLLVHVDRWREFATAHAAAASPDLDVVMIGASSVPGPVPGVHVTGFELRVHALPLPEVPVGTSVACEIDPDSGHEVLKEIASAEGGYVGKLRTGGTTAAAFPSEATVAGVVVDAVRLGAPMKFTAGLHHAVRFRDDDSGFEHHGFVNLLVAVHSALRGHGPREVAAVLARRDGSDLADEVWSWSDEDVAGVRRAFVSFGCCGVEDPITDLVALGLVERNAPTEDQEPSR